MAWLRSWSPSGAARSTAGSSNSSSQESRAMPGNLLEMSDPCFTAVQTADQLTAIATVAQAIWREYYVPLIGAEQVEYMLEKFQNVPAMRTQMERGDEYFMIQRGAELLGYLAVRADETERSMFISKLYLKRAARGTGSGRQALHFIEA